jgi:hypothetical protein
VRTAHLLLLPLRLPLLLLLLPLLHPLRDLLLAQAPHVCILLLAADMHPLVHHQQLCPHLLLCLRPASLLLLAPPLLPLLSCWLRVALAAEPLLTPLPVLLLVQPLV